ncbi:oligosaccharide flippase family protein [Gammaproteobacteria bacterium]|nr:oligosaccharide flippase family protein [Gammaproteobacteria bacterium]
MASIKIIAISLGPSGLGLYSIIRQAMFTFGSVGSGGQTAIVQGISSRDSLERDTYIRTVFWLFVCGTFITVALIQAFSPLISTFIFRSNSDQYVSLVRWIALPVVLFNTYIFLKSLLNGYRAIGMLAIVEIIGPFVTLLIIYPVCIWVGKGYALGFVWMLSVSHLVMIIFSFYVAKKNGWVAPIFFKESAKIDKLSSHAFFKFAGTTLVIGLLSAGSLLFIRAMIIGNGGLNEAGLFDVAWMLSSAYVMVILGSFGTYYMPTLTGTSNISDRLVLIHQVLRLSTLLMIPLIVTAIMLKPLLVNVLFSSEFLPSLEMLRWMLIGDFFKIISWVFAIPVLANADMRVYFWIEAFWNIGFVLLSSLAIYVFEQIQGISIAFIFLYACTIILYVKYAQRHYDFRLSLDLLLPWVGGFFIVVFASWFTWNDTAVSWPTSFALIMTSLLFVWLMLKNDERISIISRFRLIWHSA